MSSSRILLPENYELTTKSKAHRDQTLKGVRELKKNWSMKCKQKPKCLVFEQTTEVSEKRDISLDQA